MGQDITGQARTPAETRAYTKALLRDVRALERMLAEGRFETGVRRIGAEQEMFLVDRDLRPAPVAAELLAENVDPRIVGELARFNLEANVSPRLFEGLCFSELETELKEVVQIATMRAANHDARVVLSGILPTLRLEDLSLENMTPRPRYRALNDTLRKMRGGDFNIAIKGIDELNITHDNVMFEACNTSFQIHFQVAPDEFAKLHNVAQLVSAPVLAAACFSPVLFGSRLWHETRIALFSSSIDERSNDPQQRSKRPRVTFGDQWVREGVLEIFREQVSRFRVVLASEPDEDPVAVVERGETPKLSALRLHNGTVYRWNRACYGVTDGVPHLRIENRVLPAGPTVVDEVANAAFFFGLMNGVLEELGDPAQWMEFDAAKDNFFAAARHGLKAQFTWRSGETVTAADLIRTRLLPLAREGLRHSKVDDAEISRYLDVIAARVKSGQTGSAWVLGSITAMGKDTSPDLRNRRLVSAMMEHQKRGTPIHLWDPAEVEQLTQTSEEWRRHLREVGQFMTTDLFTVRPGDLVDLAASVMEWEHIRHVPVEDEDGKLVGLLTHRDLLRLVARGGQKKEVLVDEMMVRDPITVSRKTPTLEALRKMREKNVGCLPVVEDDRLVGIITASDLIRVSSKLLERFLEAEDDDE